jgi:outer membrane protein assembly factor BamB
VNNPINMRFSIFWFVVIWAACGTTGGINITHKRSPSSQIPWTAVGGGWDRSGYRDVRVQTPLKLRWKISATSAVAGGLAIADNLVYFTTKDGRVYCVRLTSGEMVGRIRYVHPSLAGLAIHGASAFYGLSNGKRTFIHYDLMNSNHRYAEELGQIETNPIAYEDFVYAGSLNGWFYCVNIADGTLHWKFKAAKPIHASAAVMVNDVFFACDSGNVYNLNRFNGRMNWIVRTGETIYATPVSDGELVYVGTTQGAFYALSRADGSVRWKTQITQPTPGNVFSGAALGPEIVAVGSTNGGVYAFERTTGKLRWVFMTGATVSTTPILTATHVLVGSQDTYFYAIDVKTGEETWKFKTDGRIRTHPALYDHTIVIASENNKVYALDF